MRKLILVVAAVVMFGVTRTMADQTSVASKPSATKYGAPEAVELTGTRLKTTYRRWDRVQDSAFNVSVIDRRSIERSGATSLAALLRYYGVH